MKKVLVIASNCFSTTSNNGKTYAAILSRYPKENLGQIYFTFSEEPNFDLCENYFRLTDVDVVKSFYRGFCGVEIQSNLSSEEISSNTGNKFVNFSKKIITPGIRNLLWIIGKWYDNGLKRWLNKFSPDLIFYVGGRSFFSNRIANTLSKDLNIPLVTYYTDDYLINSVPRNIFYPFVKFLRNYTYKQTVKQSSLLYVIGEEMARVYSNYFKKEFKFIMNSVDILPFRKYEFSSTEIIISYFGGLHLNRWKAIIKLSECLPKNCNIYVYTLAHITEEMRKAFNRSANVKLCGGTSGNEMLEKMYLSNFLLHIESDDKHNRRLTSLSVSTKIPEYLMAARPILAFGPKEVASIKLISENNLGFVVDSELESDEINSLISDIISDKEHLSKIAKRGYEYAIEHFNRERNALRLFDDLELL